MHLRTEEIGLSPFELGRCKLYMEVYNNFWSDIEEEEGARSKEASLFHDNLTL